MALSPGSPAANACAKKLGDYRIEIGLYNQEKKQIESNVGWHQTNSVYWTPRRCWPRALLLIGVR